MSSCFLLLLRCNGSHHQQPLAVVNVIKSIVAKQNQENIANWTLEKVGSVAGPRCSELNLLSERIKKVTQQVNIDNYSSTYVSNFDGAELQSSRSWLCT